MWDDGAVRVSQCEKTDGGAGGIHAGALVHLAGQSKLLVHISCRLRSIHDNGVRGYGVGGRQRSLS